MNNYKLFKEYKIQASLLLKQIRSNNLLLAEKAIIRIKILPIFSKINSLNELQIIVKRKHVLNIIAIENGFNNWMELKFYFSKNPKNFYIEGFLNKWFANYEEAKLHLISYGGYLLPYKKQFFICDKDYIEALGLDSNCNDLVHIGFDFVKPKNKQAWNRIMLKFIKF